LCRSRLGEAENEFKKLQVELDSDSSTSYSGKE
ncbi:MAG: hypothetical protein G01um101429_703, partial [Parcubacteria group bacterium Gr01-1014_29]